MQNINHMCAIGIIYKQSSPDKVFMEIKTVGYPRLVFENKGLLIGGNWIGEAASGDTGPGDTFKREFKEEITFEKPIADQVELALLFDQKDLGEYIVGSKVWSPKESEIDDLSRLKQVIISNLKPFADFLTFVPESLFQQKEPGFNKGDFNIHCSVFESGVSDDDWETLLRLQKLAGNLSNESVSIVTSLDEILKNSWGIAWGHDYILKEFFESKDLSTNRFPLIPEIEVEKLSEPLSSYGDYLQKYEVDRKPE